MVDVISTGMELDKEPPPQPAPLFHSNIAEFWEAINQHSPSQDKSSTEIWEGIKWTLTMSITKGTQFYDSVTITENYGHSVIDKYGDQLGVPPVFVLSDPDLELNPKMPLDAIDQLYALSLQYQRHRIGLALSIADYDQFLDGEGKQIHDREAQY